MYTIKRAAEQVGISTATLRAWELRYGIVAPERTDGGYRIYDENHVRVLQQMAKLVEEGQVPSLAAREVLSQRGTRMLTTCQPIPHAAVDDPEGHTHLTSFAELMIEAAASLDATALSAVLNDMFALATYEPVVDRYLLPAMDALGNAWASGRVSVAGEHLASHAVMRRLGMVYESASSFGGNKPRILIGLAPGVRHEVGLFAFAVAARRCGLATDYLGADLPVADWISSTVAPDVAAIVLALPTVSDIVSTAAVVSAVRSHRSDLLIAVGGSEQKQAPAGVLRLGHAIGPAACIFADAIDVAVHPDRPS